MPLGRPCKDEVKGLHGSDQREASLNPQEAAGEGTVVLPSPGWEDEARTSAHVSFPHPRHGHGLKPQESGTGAWATSPRYVKGRRGARVPIRLLLEPAFKPQESGTGAWATSSR